MVRKHILDSLSAEEIENNVYLGILANESTLFNPLARIPPQYEDSPELYLLYLMRQPEYFYFFINKVLGYDMHPLHMSIFRDMWNRKFPMLIASRGWGKAELLDNMLLTPDGWMRMGDVKVGQKIYGRDGFQYDVTDIHPQGKKQVYRVTTLDGRFVDCCEDHLWVVKKRTKEKVLSTKEMYESGVKNVGPSGRHSYKYRIPNCEPIQYDEKELPVDPYLMGYLIGNGTMNGSTPKFSTDDMFVVEEFKNRLDGFKIEQDLSNNNWTIVDENKEMIEVHAGNRHYFAKIGNRLAQTIKRLGLNKKCEEKFIPDIYKFSSVEQRMELVRGLVDSDGCVNESGAIEFTNTCEKVVNDISDVLRSLGISCRVAIDDRSGQIMKMPQGDYRERTPHYRVYINTSKPVSKLPRKAKRLKKSATSTEKYNSITSIEKLDKFEEMQCISVNSPDSTYITKDYLVTHNSFSLGMYALMRACMLPNRKIIITGAGFRQSKIIFDYIDNFWSKSPLLKSAYDLSIDGPSRGADLWQYKIGGSVISCVPLGDGSKIRGLRAQDLLCDEFGSIPEDIYEQVLVGFAAVSSDPLNNVKKKAYEQFCERFKHQVKKLRVPTIDKFNKQTENNQLMISGTAYYEWNHFYKYFQRYRNILYTKGDKRKLEALFGGPVPKHFDWSNYAIYRVPFDLIPPGFMDEESVARSKLTVHSEIYGMEYDAVFSKDSNGFFKRSLIESCVVNEANKGKLPCKEIFKARLHGDKDKKYVYGIDPASERDNLAVIILEVHPDHWRVAHCWTTTRARYKKMVKHGLEKDQEFYAFVCRKIRDLDKRFPCHSIALDAQGGGYALLEALQSEAHLEVGEERLLEVIEHNKPKDSDAMYGRHIIHMIQFANAKWTAEANHNLKFDLESRRILFPYFDSVELELAFQEDQRKLKALNLQSEKDADLLIDSLEVCVEEIEQLKDELSNIVHSATAGGTERWDTPEVKTGGKSVGHMRKDRYSALVMANAVARTVNVYETHKAVTSAPGGALSQIGTSTGQAFSGNSPLAQMLNRRYSEMG